MKTQAKNKLYFILGFAALLLATCGFIIWFAFGLIQKAGKDIAGLQEELAVMEAQRERLSELSKEYDEAKNSVPLLDSALLDPNDKLKFIMLVEQYAAQTAVEHKIEASGGAAVSKTGEPMFFNVTVAGDFPNILRFINLLENAPYYLNIERVQMNGGGQSGAAGMLSGDNIVNAQLLVKVYGR